MMYPGHDQSSSRGTEAVLLVSGLAYRYMLLVPPFNFARSTSVVGLNQLRLHVELHCAT